MVCLCEQKCILGKKEDTTYCRVALVIVVHPKLIQRKGRLKNTQLTIKVSLLFFFPFVLIGNCIEKK